MKNTTKNSKNSILNFGFSLVKKNKSTILKISLILAIIHRQKFISDDTNV